VFNDKFTACHLKTASAVGINPFEGGWQRVKDRLSKYTKCGEYDFSDYDSSLGVYKMLVVCAFRFKCYAPEEQTWDNWHRLLNCYRNLIWSVCVTIDGTLIIKPGGNPSGGANTVVDNTLINYWSLAYAWYQTVSDEYKNYESFDNLVTSTLYGDDNSNCVADEISDQFTPTAYCEAVKELGMTCNPVADKWLTIDEITFLQADFTTTLDGKTVYHLVPSKMYESIKWSTDWSNPCMDMQRAVGMLRVAWSDPPARAYFRKIIDFLFNKFDPIMCNVPEWKAAKSGHKTDAEYAAFYLGFETSCDSVSLYCKDQKDIQTNSNLKTMEVFLRGEARRGKRKAKKGKAPPVPSRKSANYAAARKHLMQTRGNKNAGRGRGRGRPRAAGANVRIVQAPVSTANEMTFPKQKRPMFVQHFEKLADIDGTSAFSTTTYDLNPGLAATFPWMANLANNFEFYQFVNLEFWYIQATATSTVGTVYMAFDPDAIDGAPVTSTALVDLDVKIMGSPYINQKLRIPPKSKFAKDLFIRTGSVSNTDLKTYDLGIFVIATDGFTVTSKIGALFVSYRTKLISPELPISSTGVGMSIQSTAPITSSLFASSVNTGTTLATISGNVLTLTTADSPLLISWILITSDFGGGAITVTASAGTLSSVANGSYLGDASIGYSAILTGGVAGTTLTFACTISTGTNSNLYLALMPTGLTMKKHNIDDKLFKQFMEFMEEERESRVDEDKLLLRRVLEMQAELDEISKRHQDEEEGFALSDEEELTEVIVDASSHQKVVRLKKELCVEPQYNVESSFARGSELARNAKKIAMKSRGDLLPTPTETISIGKGKDK